MTDEELNNIPKFYIPGIEKAIRPGARVCWGASIFQEEHQGRKAVGMIGLLASLVDQLGVQPHVLVNDTGNRHNYKFQTQSDERSAHAATYNFGQQWVETYAPYFEYFGIQNKPNAQRIEDMLFLQWQYFLKNPRKEIRDEIECTQDAHRCIATHDKILSAAYDQAAEEYMSRASRGPELSPALFEEGKQASRTFLIEETATLAVTGRRYDAILYPKRMLACHERPAAGIYDLPDDLTWDDIPARVAATAEPDQTPAQALLHAASGFERMRWIQVKRDPKKRMAFDVKRWHQVRNRERMMQSHYSKFFANDEQMPRDLLDMVDQISQPVRPEAERFTAKKPVI